LFQQVVEAELFTFNSLKLTETQKNKKLDAWGTDRSRPR